MKQPHNMITSKSLASPSPAETAHGHSELFHEKAGTDPASDFLFVSEEKPAKDGLIRSILDLTRELAKLGLIEIHTQPNGADFYRIIYPRKSSRYKVRHSPTGELAARVAAIFGRRKTSLWSKDEIETFKVISFDLEDLALVEEYYRSEAKKPDNYCRKSLLTFLHNYTGEVDRARRWKENSSRRHSY
jgi:hypothetical protein